jgi:plastocyanin
MRSRYLIPMIGLCLLSAAVAVWSVPEAKGQGPPGTVTVGIFDNFYRPRTMVVPLGTTVVWVNYGDRNHTVTSNAGLWPDSGALGPGQEYAVLFDLPGTYFYYCRLHTAQQMRGKIIVPDPRRR